MTVLGFVISYFVFAFFMAGIMGGLGLKSFDEELKTTREQWSLRLHHVLGYVGLIGGSVGILYQIQRIDNDATTGLILFTAGFVVMELLLAVIVHFIRGRQARNTFYLVLCCIFVVSLFMYFADRKVVAKRLEVREASIAEMAAEHREAKREWLEDIMAARAHGPVGEFPPMLQVTDNGGSVRIRNLAQQSVCVRVSRQRRISSGEYRTQCMLLSANRGAECSPIAVDAEEWFELAEADQPACLGRPLSFQVGQLSDAKIVWWSDPELEILRQELKNPPGDYGNTGRFTIDESLDYYRSLRRQGDRAAWWRSRVQEAELARPPNVESTSRPISMEAAQELNAAGKRVAELERLQRKLKPGDKNMPRELEVTSDFQGEVVLTSRMGKVNVRLLRLAKGGDGVQVLCGMNSAGSDSDGTLILDNESATFHLSPGYGCYPEKRPPLQVEIRDEGGRLFWMSPELLELRLHQARIELRVIEASAR